MSTIKTTLPGAFSGPTVSSLPLFLHGIPVSGFGRRFVAASRLDVAAGSPVPSVPDISVPGSANAALAQATTAAQPTMRLHANGFRYLEFDGTDDTMDAGSLGASNAQPCSIAIVGRWRGAPASGSWPIFATSTGGTGATSRVSSGAIALYAGSTFSPGHAPGTNWHVLISVFNGASSVSRMDSAEASGNVGSGSMGTLMRVGPGASAGAYVPLDVAEVVVWPGKALDPTERAAVHTALKGAYGL